MLPPPVQMAPYCQGDFQQLSYEPNARTLPDYGLSQPVARPDVNVSIPGTNSQHFLTPSPYNQPPPAMALVQSSDALEDQLRHMILRNDPPPDHQQTTSGPSLLTPSPQVSATSRQGNFRRPNQAQRKQQAQQVQLTLQHTSKTTSVTDMHHAGQLQHHGARVSAGRHGVNHQTTSNQLQFDINQRRPHGAVSQPQSLFDPNAGSSRRRGGNHGHKVQAVDNQEQLSYVDQLANAKIPEVQISPEELYEKQSLKQRLNDICRKLVLDHELESNPEFPRESVELKSFGSLSIGFATKESDMDLVLVSPESKPGLSSPESAIPKMVEKALMDLGYGARLLTQTRVPIIKFCESPHPELAAHLRLTRLHWERENEIHAKRANSEAAQKPSEASVEKPVDFQSQEASDQNPSALADPALVDNNKAESVIAPAKGEEGKAPLREKLENEPAWLPTLSDYELIGLFKTAIKEDRCAPHQRAIITASLQNLENQSASGGSSVLQKSRETLWNLPDVIRKCRVPGRGELEFPKSGVGTQCDINFSNQLALQNSLLLKCYSLCDPRVRQMVLFVKAWTKVRKINSPYHGTLNSYGYVLMVLHFLMNVAQPPLIPNLQLATDMIQNDPLSSREDSLDGYNIQFFRNEAALQEMAQKGVFGQNKESLGSLLRSFFQFYANPPFGTFSWKDDVLSLRTKGGILTKVGKGWVGARTEMVDLAGPGQGQKKVNHHYVVAIEDPFETGHNVARTVFFNGVVAIRDEFRRATDLISCGGMDPQLGPQDFFAEGKKNENLQHRNGPSRKDVGQKKDSAPVKSNVPERDRALKKDRANKKAEHVTNNPAPRGPPTAGKVKVNTLPHEHQEVSAPTASPAELPSKLLESTAATQKPTNAYQSVKAPGKKPSPRKDCAPENDSELPPDYPEDPVGPCVGRALSIPQAL